MIFGKPKGNRLGCLIYIVLQSTELNGGTFNLHLPRNSLQLYINGQFGTPKNYRARKIGCKLPSGHLVMSQGARVVQELKRQDQLFVVVVRFWGMLSGGGFEQLLQPQLKGQNISIYVFQARVLNAVQVSLQVVGELHQCELQLRHKRCFQKLPKTDPWLEQGQAESGGLAASFKEIPAHPPHLYAYSRQ
jgi:hypothetical protein